MVGDKETSMLSAIVYLSVGLTRTVIRNSKVTRGHISSHIRLHTSCIGKHITVTCTATLLLKHSLATLDFFGSLNGNYA